MSTTAVHHAQLGATVNGVVVESHGVKLNQFKGIKYGNIPGRFEIAQPVAPESLNGKTIDATKFGYAYIYMFLTLSKGKHEVNTQ